MQSAVSFELPFRPHYTVDCLGLFGISNPKPMNSLKVAGQPPRRANHHGHPPP